MPDSVELFVRIVRRGMLWLVGGLSVLAAVAFVHLLITPDRIARVSTGSMLIALVLLLFPGLTLLARRAERPAKRPARAQESLPLRLTGGFDRRRAA
ncbi:MAG: hypothetical protein ACF8SC_11375 [Phycisphaerales bacterium JB037]